MEHEVNAIVDEAVQFADDSPHPDLSELYTDVAEPEKLLVASCQLPVAEEDDHGR